MTKLSVNLNKVATLRNVRHGNSPDLLTAAEICLEAGAAGITVHPRPDQRHIRYEDVSRLSHLLRQYPEVEFNIEGFPSGEFLALVLDSQPHQCTLVPDAPDAVTSDHGWDITSRTDEMAEWVATLRAAQIRVSLFLDPTPDHLSKVAAIGADRIELYTEPYVRAFGGSAEHAVLTEYARTAEKAGSHSLGVNAGHDLNLINLGPFCAAVPSLLEVSIGHALISHAFEVGLYRAVGDYLEVLARYAHAA
jgi:pyridoxine 5-phosphate synthase